MNSTIEGLAIGAGIYATIREDWNDNAPEWAQNKARHYRVQLRYQKRTMSLWYYQGLGITREPKVADILECLSCDLMSDHESLDDFILESGLEIKSVSDFRAYERQYKQLKSQNKRFTRLIGNLDLIHRLQEVA
jgi:uncharacterized protein YdcH (DUF465 family)